MFNVISDVRLRQSMRSFTPGTILPNFIPIRFETTYGALDFFEQRLPNKNKKG